MKECPKGHSYDEKENESCPFCEAYSEDTFSVKRNVMPCVYGPPPEKKLRAEKKAEKRKGILSRLFKK